MKKTVTVLTLLLFSIAMSGCAAILSGGRGKVATSTNPTGAKVYVNGDLYGNTPIILKLKTKQEYTVEFKMDGYETVTHKITNKVGVGWIIVDVIFGLVPIIVDAATGAWYTFDQKSINAELEKQQ